MKRLALLFLSVALVATSSAVIPTATSQQAVADKLQIPSKADPGTPAAAELWLSTTSADTLKYRSGSTTFSLASISYLVANYQPLDSDLSAIAALSTTSYGRSFLTQADASAGRTYLGLGTIATEAASDYLTKAGNLSGLGSTSTARSNLGVAIGSDVQAYDSDLTAWAGVNPSAYSNTSAINGWFADPSTNGSFAASEWRSDLGLGTMATETASDYLTKAGNLSGLANTATARSNLGLAIGTNVQAFHANLQSLSGVTAATDKLPYFDSGTTMAVADFTSFGRSLVDDANAAAARSTLGLGNVENTALSTWAGSTNLTTLGTITTGTWNGSTIGVPYGGTGAATLTQDGILVGNGTSAVSAPGALLTSTYLALGTGYTSGLQAYNVGSPGATNFERLEAFWSSNTATIRLAQGGTGTNRPLRLASTNSVASLTLSNAGASGQFQFVGSTTGATNAQSIRASGTTFTNTSGTANILGLEGAYNQASGSSANTDFPINVTLTAVGSGAQKFADWQVSGTSWYSWARGSTASTGAFNASSGTEVASTEAPNFSGQTSTAGWTAKLINVTDGSGSGNRFFLQAQLGGSDRALLHNSGALALASRLTLGTTSLDSANLFINRGGTIAAWGTSGPNIRLNSSTWVDSSTATSGTAATAVFSSLGRPTLSASNTGVHTTDGATFYIAGTPINGTNNTVDNPWAQWNDQGASRFDGGAVREAGGASARANFAGPLYMNLTAVGNVGAGEDDLISQTIAASVLATNGDTLRITTPVTFAANSNSKNVKVYWNGTAVYASGALAINSGAAEIVTTITRTGSATQNITVHVVSGNSTLASSATFATGSATLSGTVVFKLTGEATSDNDISEKQMIAEYLPAPI